MRVQAGQVWKGEDGDEHIIVDARFGNSCVVIDAFDGALGQVGRKIEMETLRRRRPCSEERSGDGEDDCCFLHGRSFQFVCDPMSRTCSWA